MFNIQVGNKNKRRMEMNSYKITLLTEAQGLNGAWMNLIAMVRLVAQYEKEHATYPGKADHATFGTLVLTEDALGNYLKENP